MVQLRGRKNITVQFRPDRFSETCQVLTELNLLQTLRKEEARRKSLRPWRLGGEYSLFSVRTTFVVRNPWKNWSVVNHRQLAIVYQLPKWYTYIWQNSIINPRPIVRFCLLAWGFVLYRRSQHEGASPEMKIYPQIFAD